MGNQRTVVAPAGQHIIAFTREFEADAVAVFAAHTDGDLVARWVGPRGTRLAVTEFDARTGGSWSYVVSSAAESWAFHGSFHEVTAPSRIVQTFEYDGEPEHPCLEVLTFSDIGDGRSRIEGVSIYPTVDDRDAVLGNGLDAARDDDFERLDELLATGV